MLQLCVHLRVEIGKSNDLRSWLSSNVNSEGSDTGQCQSKKTRAGSPVQYCSSQGGRERREGLSEDGMGETEVKTYWKKERM